MREAQRQGRGKRHEGRLHHATSAACPPMGRRWRRLVPPARARTSVMLPGSRRGRSIKPTTGITTRKNAK